MSLWKKGTCDCCEALPAFCIAISCGVPIIQGISHHEMHGGQGGAVACLLSTFCGPIGAAINRQQIRNKYGISGNCFIECLLYTFGLGTCLATQEYHEVYLSTKSGQSQNA